MTENPEFLAAEKLGHELRSKLLDQFSRVERWVTSKSHSLGRATNKAPIGQRLTLITQQAEQFKKPAKIKELADRVSKALVLRCDIVHSHLQTAISSEGDPIWIFANVADGECWKPTVLTKNRFTLEIAALKMLAKELEDQKLKAQAPAAHVSTTV
jgi:hypothetical protein